MGQSASPHAYTGNGQQGSSSIPPHIEEQLIDRFGTESLAYLEEQYDQYLRNPGDTPTQWKDLFEELGLPDDLPPQPDFLNQRLPTIFRPPLARSKPGKQQKITIQ